MYIVGDNGFSSKKYIALQRFGFVGLRTYENYYNIMRRIFYDGSVIFFFDVS